MICKKSLFLSIKLCLKVNEMREQKTGAPVFVKVDEYKEILDVLEMIRAKVNEIKQTIGSLKSLRSEEDAELDVWENAISEIERKIAGIDKIMFEPEHVL